MVAMISGRDRPAPTCVLLSLAMSLCGCRDIAGLSGLEVTDETPGAGGAGAPGGAGAGAASGGSGASGGQASGGQGTGGQGTGGQACVGWRPPSFPNVLIVSVELTPENPLVFHATFDPPDDVELIALRADDHTMTTGQAQDAEVDLERGFELVAQQLEVPGDADPIFGIGGVVDMTLIGETCDQSSVCGTMTGEIPRVGPTDGSFVLLVGTDHMEPFPINCDGDLADPP
jgi:hypothetical protein